MKSRNFRATIVLAIAPGTANTEFSVAHELDTIPRAGFVIRQNASGQLYESGTAWTATTAYLKSDTALVTYFVLFVS